MHAHNHKLDHASVVAVFDTQDAAEGGVLGLREAGFPDARVGYFARNLEGLVTDYVWKGYTVLGIVIGVIVGAVLGAWCGQVALRVNAPHFAPAFMAGDAGVVLTFAVCGAVLTGFIGGLVGWGVPRGDAVHYGDEMRGGRYVVSVNAGDRRDEAAAVLHRRGGHAPLPGDAVEVPAGLAPAM
jgi:hypothetical protein